MTRAEHLAWAKERALAYLPEDVIGAGTSFINDLGKHPDLSGHVAEELIGMHMMSGLLNEKAVRDLITGAC